MGIRYLAVSIDQQDFDHLSVGTCPTCGEEPRLRDVDCEEHARQHTLDLDKSWGDFQRVLHSEPTRPAAALVHGRVTDTYDGWRSYRGLIAPADVPRVTDDLATITAEYVRDRMRGGPQCGDDNRDHRDFEHLCHFLHEAQEFTKKVATEGRAIVYYIG